MNKPKALMFESVSIKYREPESADQVKVGILLHGWTGDESSMWVFGDKLDQNWLLIAPRAPYHSAGAGLGGYSWVDQSIQQWPTYQDFFPAVNYLDDLIDTLSETFPYADFSKLNLMGFSQGAAMALVYAGRKTPDIQKLILLSGFLPEGYEGFIDPELFEAVDIFIGHGNKDDIVPVARASEINNLFRGYGKTLVFCTSDVGHRLGSDCFNALQKFTNE